MWMFQEKHSNGIDRKINYNNKQRVLYEFTEWAEELGKVNYS